MFSLIHVIFSFFKFLIFWYTLQGFWTILTRETRDQRKNGYMDTDREKSGVRWLWTLKWRHTSSSPELSWLILHNWIEKVGLYTVEIESGGCYMQLNETANWDNPCTCFYGRTVTACQQLGRSGRDIFVDAVSTCTSRKGRLCRPMGLRLWGPEWPCTCQQHTFTQDSLFLI